MPEVWTRGGRLGAIFGAWTLFGLLFASQGYLGQVYLGHETSWRDALVSWLMCGYSWAVLTPFVVRFHRRCPITRRGFGRALVAHAVAGLAFSVAAMLLFSLGQQALRPEHHPLQRGALERLLIGGLHVDLLIYATLVAGACAVDHHRRYRERELAAAELAAALAQAELTALRAQLHPHFLFNTLNTIAILMEEDARAARKMLVHLSALLRALLSRRRTQEVSVQQELELLESYLEIERVRFQDRLQVSLRVAPDALDARVPDLLLQPLVENAIKYGVLPRPGGGRVEVDVQRRGDELRLEVRDDGPGLGAAKRPAPGSGLGLSTTRVRLEKLYPNEHHFELESGESGGLRVILRLPFAVYREPCAG